MWLPFAGFKKNKELREIICLRFGGQWPVGSYDTVRWVILTVRWLSARIILFFSFFSAPAHAPFTCILRRVSSVGCTPRATQRAWLLCPSLTHLARQYRLHLRWSAWPNHFPLWCPPHLHQCHLHSLPRLRVSLCPWSQSLPDWSPASPLDSLLRCGTC